MNKSKTKEPDLCSISFLESKSISTFHCINIYINIDWNIMADTNLQAKNVALHNCSGFCYLVSSTYWVNVF